MKTTNTPSHPFQRLFLLPLTFLIIVSMACNLPGLVRPRPTSTPTASVQTPIPTSAPTPTARPPVNLPPTLVEASPLPGSEIALKAPIVLAFNQAMDQASVESALKGQPTLSGKITWIDDATLSFTPDQSLLPATKVSLTINNTAKAANGLALAEPVTVNYTTAEPLSLIDSLPVDGVTDAAPTSAVVASFNQPVVPLGAEDNTIPAAFSLQPSASGRGQWLNTSTYIFYPDPVLAAGTDYTVQLNPDLVSTNGTTFADGTATSWSFTTALPAVDSVVPAAPANLRLDGPIIINFNISMDPASVESNFSLKDPSGNPVSGQFSWDAAKTSLTFTPDSLLTRATTYTLLLNGQTQAYGGAPLENDYSDQLQTYSSLAVVATDPPSGGPMESYGSGYGTVSVFFNSPLKSVNLSPYFSITPSITNLAPYLNVSPNSDSSTYQISFSNFFLPNTTYTLTVSADLPDAWGGTLGQAYQFQFNTPPASPALIIDANQMGSSAIYLTPADTGIAAQATNLTRLSISVGKISLAELTALIGPNGYNLINSFKPANPISWTQTLSLTPDRSEKVVVQIAPGGKSLAPGLYFLTVSSSQLASQGQNNPIHAILVVSPTHLTFKMSVDQVLVWAVNLPDNSPKAGGAVSIYDQNNNLIASGQTDAQGLFQADITTLESLYESYYAVLGQPGDSDFGFSSIDWSYGLSGYDLGISVDYTPPYPKVYIYTDRPIYRPGQIVNFRAIVRQENNGRYAMPDLNALTVKILGDAGMSGKQPELFNQDLSLSQFGSVYASYTIPANASPGYYTIEADTGSGDYSTSYLSFQVANYIKPEINLQVELSPGEIQSGQSISAKVDAQYFFGAPAGGVALSWKLYRRSNNIVLPQYQIGVLDTSWMQPYWMRMDFGSSFGSVVTQGEGTTAQDGTFNVSIPADTLILNASDSTQTLTFEATVQDENDQPVSQRASATMHPSDFYIGIRPDAWSSQSGSALGFSLKTVDWKSQPVGNKALSAEFSKIVWVEQPSSNPYDPPQYESQTTLVSSANPTTNVDGQARLSFTPPDPGTYVLDVTGGGAHTQTLVWVSGPGSATWPTLTNHELHLTADAESYQAGQTANVFIPNPFGAGALALVTHERGKVMDSQVITLSDAGYNLQVALTGDDAPNIYLAVTLIGKTSDTSFPDFRQGYINLQVAPQAQTLKVDVTVDPPHATAGQDVTITLKVTDASGSPVQGEFSLGVADLAALVLADPNSPDILSAFYGIQPLGIRTAVDLNGYGGNNVAPEAGLGRGGGGGGGDMALSQAAVRSNFQDTAYWDAAIVTGTDGTAQVTVTLPDNLTTWQVDVRGITSDTLVGQATSQVITSKDLIVRPQTPTFMVVGDHTTLAAIVNNNTSTDLQVAVSLQSNGFNLDDPTQTVQTVPVPANGHTSVIWWGTAQDVPTIDLVFKASSGNLEDTARPELGKLTVLHYSSPQTFSTSGVLSAAGSRLEVVSLPRSFTPTGGQLSLEISPSLAATLINGLKSLENPDTGSTVAVLASFLPNLEAARALSGLGIDAPDLQTDLDQKVSQGINSLLNHQNSDGGWFWWNSTSNYTASSDPYISAYVVFGLSRAIDAGYDVSSYSMDQAKQFLSTKIITPKPTDNIWDLDRLAFVTYALQSSGETTLSGQTADLLYGVRLHLSPWAQAMTALTLDAANPGDDRVKTMISDLESNAIRSSTGVNWESADASWYNPGTPVTTTAIVLYAVAQKDPAASLTSDALRYLLANRSSSGSWGSTYETGWVLMALTEVLKGTGEFQASYSYDVTLNDSPLASGEANGPNGLTTVTSVTPLDALDATQPNALVFNRDGGTGRLYYRADLRVDRPIESAPALSLGLSLERSYYLAGQDCSQVDCQPINEVQLGQAAQTQAVTVRLTLTVPHDMYNLEVEDYIPSGAVIFNPNLKTSQQGLSDQATGLPEFDPGNPFRYGWGWWIFDNPQIYDDHVLWTAGYVPSGTYQLTYTLIPTQAGEFRVIPAHAWEAFFPEVQGTTEGAIFTIKP